MEIITENIAQLKELKASATALKELILDLDDRIEASRTVESKRMIQGQLRVAQIRYQIKVEDLVVVQSALIDEMYFRLRLEANR